MIDRAGELDSGAARVVRVQIAPTAAPRVVRLVLRSAERAPFMVMSQ